MVQRSSPDVPPKATGRWLPLVCGLALPGACLLMAIGCESNINGGPTSRPGDAALKDPFGYKPMEDIPPVDGGGIGGHRGLKRDFDAFINP